MEAARAGDAGKGFVVVVSKVKNLAGETAKATEGISTQITEFQSVKNEFVAAIHGIIWIIRKINNVETSITLAVEEQGVATQEITHNVEQAAMGTNDVTINITVVNQPTQEAGAGAGAGAGAAADTVLSVFGELTEQSMNLSHKSVNS